MKRYFFVPVLLILFPVLALAKGSDNKRLGVGVNLGEPIGASAKFFIFDRLAAEATLGYGFGEQGFIIQPSLLLHLRRIFDYDGETYSIVPYGGLGLKTGVDLKGAHDGSGIAALRIPIGASCFLKEGRLEASVEFSPGIEFAPGTEFDPTAGIGIRYYFF